MSCSFYAPYARMSQQVYQNNGGTPPPGFNTVTSSDLSNGFQGTAYFNPTTGELVIAYAGTDPLSGGDLWNDLQIIPSLIPSQFASARDFYQAAVAAAGNPSSITITGHSLGGALAQLVGAAESQGETGGPPPQAVTFNAPGVQSIAAANPGMKIDPSRDYPNITNISNFWDPVSKWDSPLGNSQSTPGGEMDPWAGPFLFVPFALGTALGYGQLGGFLLGQHSIDAVMDRLCRPTLPNTWDLEFPEQYADAKRWRWPRDPILLDLDGDGLETVGLASNVYFDHDGDGVLTKTGWAGKDDALLVWDRNANGTIDTGAELFGDFTPLPNGTLAPNGFAALAALDSNGDGVIDANDAAFAELKLWRDTSQDGKTGEGELISLTDAGIVSLNLAHTLKNQNLANGNQLTREGSFTRTDGTTGGMGEFRLAIDTFDTQFAQAIEVPESLKDLPNMGGAGNVRELQQAAAQSAGVAAVLAQFQGAPTRAEQKALLDQLIAAWADTSGMARSMEERTNGRYRIQYDAFGNERRSNNLAAAMSGDTLASGGALMSDALGPAVSSRYRALIAEWTQKLHILEAFNGQYFFNLPDKKSQTDGANWGLFIQAGSGGASGSAAMALEAYPILHVSFSQGQLDLLQQAYDGLKESVYASLVMQTRLRPYLDAIELVIDENGIRLDATQLNRMLADKKAADPENYLADLLDLDRYAGGFLAGTNWSGLADFDSLVDTLPQTAGIAALLNEFKVRTLTGGDDVTGLTDKADIVLAGEGKDTLYGHNGNDRLFGQAGDDRIYGGAGDDLISGGAGNDVLAGESGADTYVFGRGYGNDTISDYAENGIQRDSVRFLGLTPADIRVTADYNDNLVFTIVDTGETLSVPRGGYWWGQNGVGQYVFDDGTVWSHDDALRATVAASTENDDTIHGSSAGDAITGQAGNDILIGNGGDDVIDGGAGNDILIGATGVGWILEDGQWRQERSTTPTISANGNDTYLFGRGDGQDTVIDGDWTAGNSDTLRWLRALVQLRSSSQRHSLCQSGATPRRRRSGDSGGTTCLVPQGARTQSGALVRRHAQLDAHRRRDAQPRTRLRHTDAFGGWRYSSVGCMTEATTTLTRAGRVAA